MRTFRIATIPGDGIGQEVVAAGVEVLEAVARRDGRFRLSFDFFDWGSDHYRASGKMMPDDGLSRIKDHDAILFGAVGAPEVPDHVSSVGPAAGDLPVFRPVRQCPADARSAGHHQSAARR